MDITEKLIDSMKSANTAFIAVLIILCFVSIYLTGRTIEAIDDVADHYHALATKISEIKRSSDTSQLARYEEMSAMQYFMETRQEQSQTQVEAGPIKLDFSFWVLDTAWVWILAFILLFLGSLQNKVIRIKKELIAKRIEGMPEDIGLFSPMDFMHKDNWVFLGLITVPLIILILANIVLLLGFSLEFLSDGYYLNTLVIVLGCLVSLYALIRISLPLIRSISQGLLRR